MRETDFVLDGTLRSDGASIREMGQNHFKLTLGRVPQPTMPTAELPPDVRKHYPGRQEGWASWVRFEIASNAKGHGLRLDVEFEAPEEWGTFRSPKEGGVPYPFTSYDPCWSYDGEEWQYISWEEDFVPGRAGTLIFPRFEGDRVLVCTQLPMTVDDAESLLEEWQEHPHAEVHILGESIGGRKLHRVTVTDPQGDVPRSRRWVHHVANQHAGEGVSQWYVAGMTKWFLSDEATEARSRTIGHFTLMMNPDGVDQGWCRVNAQGIDSNRNFRVEGSDPALQPHEAFIFQRDLESLVHSDTPVTTSWAMHSSPSAKLSPMLVGRGPELRGVLESDEVFGALLKERDSKDLISDYREHHRGVTPDCFWDGGPHHAWGITTFLVEGGGKGMNKSRAIEAGGILMRALTEYYTGERDQASG